MKKAESGRHEYPDRQGALANSRNSGVPRTEVAQRVQLPDVCAAGLDRTAGVTVSSPFLVRIPSGVASMPLLPMFTVGRGLWVEYG